MIDFVGQTFSEESNESKIKHIRSIPVDSAYLCPHLVFEAKPVPIAIYHHKTLLHRLYDYGSRSGLNWSESKPA